MTQAYSRKEVIRDCTLYLGDCRDVLPTLGKVDALVTDPPYGIGAANVKRGGLRHGSSCTLSKDYGRDTWDDQPIDIGMIESLLACSDYQIIWGGNYFELPPTSCWLLWDKLTGDNGYADFEMAWTNLDKACRKIVWRWQGMLQQDMKNKEERFHPTQKSLEVMRWCINHLPKNTKNIIDPFMGSGTTGVACVNLDRKFIGIEREPKYFDIACRRIEEAYKQPRLALPEPRQLTQTAMEGL